MEFTELFKHCPTCGSAAFLQNNEKSMRCSNCDFVLYVNPSAATAAFIFNAENELLVCRRANDPAKGTFDLPGGFVDGEETAEECITRELKEELNADLSAVRYLFSLPNRYEYSNLTIPTLDMFFRCTLSDSRNLKAADDVASFEFIPIAKLDPKAFGLLSIRKAIELFLADASAFLNETC